MNASHAGMGCSTLTEGVTKLSPAACTLRLAGSRVAVGAESHKQRIRRTVFALNALQSCWCPI